MNGTELHASLLTLDGHLDAPVHFSRAGWRFADRHGADDIAQVDLPRMADGALSGGFFVTYTPQEPLDTAGYAAALAHALHRSGEIDAMLAAEAGAIGLATRADDAERLHAQGRLVAFKSMENGYPVGEDLAELGRFARAGIRLIGPVHNHANQLADSATDAACWHGLSPLGREWVAAMNRHGLVIDPSHASDAAFDQMLDLSATPLFLSHSGARAACDTPRNLDDGRLRALAAAGGVIGFTTVFLSPLRAGPARVALMGELARIGTLPPGEQATLAARWRALDAAEPMWDADLDRYMAALFHVLDVAGVEHVAFGADFDGGGGIPGLEDVSALPRITERLQVAGLPRDDIARLWSGNVLRVLRAAEAFADAA